MCETLRGGIRLTTIHQIHQGTPSIPQPARPKSPEGEDCLLIKAYLVNSFHSKVRACYLGPLRRSAFPQVAFRYHPRIPPKYQEGGSCISEDAGIQSLFYRNITRNGAYVWTFCGHLGGDETGWYGCHIGFCKEILFDAKSRFRTIESHLYYLCSRSIRPIWLLQIIWM